MSAGLIKIIHLSDLHFGDDHCFDPQKTTSGDRPSRAGWPELYEMLVKDLQGEEPGIPVIVCISGDVAHSASREEYDRAVLLVRHLRQTKIFGQSLARSSIFLVPGNHDVLYEETAFDKRSEPFIKFYNELMAEDLNPRDPYALVQLHDRIDELGVLVLSLHSAMYVQKGKEDQDRGQVDQDQLKKAFGLLKNVNREKLESAIRIALIHHHPVLIPPLAEPKKKYDAIVYGGELLNLLRQFGFHVILHGHKHYPYNFTYDARSAFHALPPSNGNLVPGEDRLVIVAGGSAGSRSIPDLGMKCNCYNHITLRWNRQVGQVRMKIETRRLRARDDRNNTLQPWEWSWDRLDEDDRSYSRAKLPDANLPAVKVTNPVPWDEVGFADKEKSRIQRYKESRGNMAVVEVMPSLVRGQDKYFEARVWIVAHNPRRETDPRRETPKRVTWSSGPEFGKVVTVAREEDENFCASFYYYGPMLIQGWLEFESGPPVMVYAYARVPASYE